MQQPNPAAPGPTPGSQNNAGQTMQGRMQQLTHMEGVELERMGKAMQARDAEGVQKAAHMIRQIKSVGASLAAQQQKQNQPQGGQTGVTTPVSRPIDPMTRQPTQG